MEHGYLLLANRDELKSRLPASPPRVQTGRGIRYAAPADGDAGGTWIGVNELGVAVDLLNARLAGPERPDDAYASRGTLVRGMLDAGGVDEVGARLSDQDLERFRGFRLAAFEPGRRPRLWRWDGEALRRESPVEAPLFSSPIEDGEVGRARRRTFERRLGGRAPDEATLLELHASHEPERGPHSVCMHADGAGTVSSSHVFVGASSITFRYADGPPCSAPFGEPLVLERRWG